MQRCSIPVQRWDVDILVKRYFRLNQANRDSRMLYGYSAQSLETRRETCSCAYVRAWVCMCLRARETERKKKEKLDILRSSLKKKNYKKNANSGKHIFTLVWRQNHVHLSNSAANVNKFKGSFHPHFKKKWFSKKREVNLHVSLDGSPLCRLRFGPLTSPAQGFEMTWQSLYF